MCIAYANVSIHVHICMGYTCSCVYVGPGLILGIFFNLPYPWSRVSQSNPEFTNTTRFTSQLASGIICLCPPSWNSRLVDTSTWRLHGSWGFELWSFCLYCKHFNHWVNPPDPKRIFIIVCSAKNRRWHTCDITYPSIHKHTCYVCILVLYVQSNQFTCLHLQTHTGNVSFNYEWSKPFLSLMVPGELGVLPWPHRYQQRGWLLWEKATEWGWFQLWPQHME